MGLSFPCSVQRKIVPIFLSHCWRMGWHVELMVVLDTLVRNPKPDG